MKKGYTKHYYNGSNRLGTKTGNFENLPSNILDSASGNKAKEYLANLPMADTTQPLNLSVHCEENLLYPILSKTAKPSDFSEITYYYHGDHLGSMSWITDDKGDIVEHRRYLPYGEEWYHKRFNVDNSRPNYVERFTFTGKERDEESGYDYFGARYYDSRLLTGWLSVDPLAGKYPYLNPYAYADLNPIKNIDPDGKKVVIGSFWGRVAASIGANNFEKKTQNNLNSLKNTNTELRQAIEGMENNQNLDVKIKPHTEHRKQTNGVTIHKYNGEIKQSSTIYYDPDNSREVEGVDVSSEGILAHELGHADDLMKGDGVTYDRGKALGINQPQDENERQKGNKAEEKAIRFENHVRAKEGKPQRSYEYYKKKEE